MQYIDKGINWMVDIMKEKYSLSTMTLLLIFIITCREFSARYEKFIKVNHGTV